MKFSISEMAKLSGVSVRTLHYYDEIELLKPSEVVPETGYRYYDEQAIQRLQQILFYRELDFPLKEIVKIMNSSEYNQQDALKMIIWEKNQSQRMYRILLAGGSSLLRIPIMTVPEKFLPVWGRCTLQMKDLKPISINLVMEPLHL